LAALRALKRPVWGLRALFLKSAGLKKGAVKKMIIFNYRTIGEN
jgi:hypothetical protein